MVTSLNMKNIVSSVANVTFHHNNPSKPELRILKAKGEENEWH